MFLKKTDAEQHLSPLDTKKGTKFANFLGKDESFALRHIMPSILGVTLCVEAPSTP